MNFSVFLESMGEEHSRYSSLLVCLFIVLVVGGGCIRKYHFLKEGEYLLSSQHIKGNKNMQKESLEPFYRMKANKKLIFNTWRPYLAIYLKGQQLFNKHKFELKKDSLVARYTRRITQTYPDTQRVIRLEYKRDKKVASLDKKIQEGNWLMRKVGEKPSVYDSALSNETARQMHLYLLTKGYFNSSVNIKNHLSGSNMRDVTYEISEGKPHTLNRILYFSEDNQVSRLLKEARVNSLIVTGERYDEQVLEKERERLERYFKDIGYFDFSRKFIFFDVDTTLKNQLVNVDILVKNPEDGNHHPYKVADITFMSDVSLKANASDSGRFEGLAFYFGPKVYAKRVLANKIGILPNEAYSSSQTQRAQRNLTQLDMFKFVNINYIKDTTAKNLHLLVTSNSLNKFQVSSELGVSVNQGFPGPFGSLTFTGRNLLKEADIFDFNLRATIEGVAGATNQNTIYQSQELSVNPSITFPWLFFPFKVNKIFRNNSPRTKFITSFNSIIRPEYQRRNARIAMTYSVQKGFYKSFSFSPLDFNYVSTANISEAFSAYLDTLYKQQGNNLIYSFRPTFASNINMSYIYNTYVMGENKQAHYLKLYAESGGTTLNLIANKFADEVFNALGVQQRYIYWKASADYREYTPTSRTSMLVTRFALGIANPYSGSYAMPYEKYFFSGGSNSNRAWLPRRLGTGSAPPVINPDGSFTYRYEQPAEIQLETNIEYRFDVIKYLEWAFFIDAGNVWNIRDNADPRATFEFNRFYKEIAVGAGFGARLDFSFLIFRVDVGIKMYDPAQPLGQRFVGSKLSLDKPLGEPGQALVNIGIGYPF